MSDPDLHKLRDAWATASVDLNMCAKGLREDGCCHALTLAMYRPGYKQMMGEELDGNVDPDKLEKCASLITAHMIPWLDEQIAEVEA